MSMKGRHKGRYSFKAWLYKLDGTPPGSSAPTGTISPSTGEGIGKPVAGQGKPGAAGIAHRTGSSGTSGFTKTSRGVSGDPASAIFRGYALCRCSSRTPKKHQASRKPGLPDKKALRSTFSSGTNIICCIYRNSSLIVLVIPLTNILKDGDVKLRDVFRVALRITYENSLRRPFKCLLRMHNALSHSMLWN